jgi:hypothetical protein
VARKHVDVEIPDGMHLGFSHDSAGARRAHLFDDETNELVGHAELFEPADDERVGSVPYAEPVYIYVNDARSNEQDDELAEALRALVRLGIIVAAEKAAPHVQRWWNDTALPSLKKTRKKLPRLRRSKDHVSVVDSRVPAEAMAEASQDVFAALEAYRASMSSAEARDRFVAALVARHFSDMQLRLLRDARIQDEDGAREPQTAMESLTPQQLEESITLMLDANPSWPDEDTLAQLRNMLDGDRADSLYSSVRREQTKPLHELSVENVARSASDSPRR